MKNTAPKKALFCVVLLLFCGWFCLLVVLFVRCLSFTFALAVCLFGLFIRWFSFGSRLASVEFALGLVLLVGSVISGSL